jgi:hypothetical protein
MPRRGRPRGRTRQFLGAIWEDGARSCIAVVAGPDEPDKGRLVDFIECDADGIANAIISFEHMAIADGSEITWLTALRGASCIVESCKVPREVESAPADTKAIACLAGTSWGDPETAEQMRLVLGYQIDGTICTIAAAHEDSVVEVQARHAQLRLRITSETAALAELVRGARTDTAGVEATATLAALCSESNASFVVVETHRPTLVRQVDLDRSIRDAAARRRPNAASPAAFEPGAAVGTANDYIPSWTKSTVDVDAATWRSAVIGEFRETLARFNESGGHVSDLACVYVSGEAAERFELRAALPRALGFDLEVRELEASRVVTSDDVDIARRVAEAEGKIAGALALLAAGRRSDLLTFASRERAEEVRSLENERQVASMGRRTRTVVSYAAAIACALGIAACVACIHYNSVTGALEDARRSLAIEERRAEELETIASEKAANEAKHAHTAALLASIDMIRDRQRIPAHLLSDIQELLPVRAGLERVEFDGTRVTIAGASEDASDADAFALNLEAAADRFADVTPATSADSYTTTPGPDTGLGPEVRPLERFSVRARIVAARIRAAASNGVRQEVR